MADDRQLARRPTARDLAVRLGLLLGYLAAVYVVAEVVYRVSGWHRLWILLVVVPICSAGLTAAQRRLDRRAGHR